MGLKHQADDGIPDHRPVSSLEHPATLRADRIWLDEVGRSGTQHGYDRVQEVMTHSSPFVREFALIGLSAHLDRTDVHGAVERMSIHDPCGHLRVDALLALVS